MFHDAGWGNVLWPWGWRELWIRICVADVSKVRAEKKDLQLVRVEGSNVPVVSLLQT